jgi:hypothetical protein
MSKGSYTIRYDEHYGPSFIALDGCGFTELPDLIWKMPKKVAEVVCGNLNMVRSLQLWPARFEVVKVSEAVEILTGKGPSRAYEQREAHPRALVAPAAPQGQPSPYSAP